MSGMFFSSKEVINQVFLFGNSVDREDLINTKTDQVALRTFVLFFNLQSLKVLCTIPIIPTSPCELGTAPSNLYFGGERSGRHDRQCIQR